MTHQLPDELRQKLTEERLKATTRFKENHNDGDLAIAQLYRNMIALFSDHTAKAEQEAYKKGYIDGQLKGGHNE